MNSFANKYLTNSTQLSKLFTEVPKLIIFLETLITSSTFFGINFQVSHTISLTTDIILILDSSFIPSITLMVGMK